jgi:GST-like protein
VRDRSERAYARVGGRAVSVADSRHDASISIKELMMAATNSRIQLYQWPAPNGGKISIVLEECGLPYDLRTVHSTRRAVRAGSRDLAQHNCCPAIIDPE